MTERLRVLHLEDKDIEAEIAQTHLVDEGVDCEVTRVETRAEYIAALDRGGFDLLLVDYTLPDFDGKTALELALQQWPDLPIIFVSGTIGEDAAIELLKTGATDYVLKSKLSRLGPAVRRALREARKRREYRQAHAALRESEERYRSLVETTVDGVYQADADGLFQFINQAGAGMFGHNSPAEMIGKPVSEYWSDPKEGGAFPDELKDTKVLRAYPLRGRKRDGSSIHLEISCHVLEDEQGRFLGNEGILRDLTEKIQLETQLRHAQKMEALGQLTGGIAHDFNNMLNVILGFSTLVYDALGADHPSAADLKEVLTAAERATALTQRLRAFSRKQPADLKVTPINDVVAGVEKMLGLMIGEGIDLTIHLSDDNIRAMADGGQIEQVLINLAANARDAMPQGGRLTISTGFSDLSDSFVASHGYGAPGKYAQISIADTGTGMDVETLRKIFEPFFTTKEVGKGTGLGLSIAYGIIKQHNGYLTVDSAPGGGTTFKILLPLLEEEAASGEKVEDSPVKGGSETILLAEDDDGLKRLFSTVLEAFGYRVITAGDGAEAIAKFVANRDKIQLVILDMIMPKKSGKEAYEEIKKTSPGVKVLFVSGYTAQIATQKEMLPEGLACVYKPLLPKTFLQKVRELLDM